MKLIKLKIDQSWTLFLDRDGVINVRLIDDYVKSIDEFKFIDKVPEAIGLFSQLFSHIFVVTNQQGIGKGLMTEDTLEEIHMKMLNGIHEKKGRIDRIYFCPNRKEENSKYRKPEIGMALHAKKEFSGVNFKKSIMVGDTLNDMKFGKRAGMFTVFITSDLNEVRENYKLVDFHFQSLPDFANALRNM